MGGHARHYRASVGVEDEAHCLAVHEEVARRQYIVVAVVRRSTAMKGNEGQIGQEVKDKEQEEGLNLQNSEANPYSWTSLEILGKCIKAESNPI